MNVGVLLKKVVLPSYQYRNHCYCVRENQPPLWMLEPLYLIVIGSSLNSSKLPNHFFISCCIGCDNHYYYCILHSIIIWEDHKLFQINQSQPSYSYFYYTLNLFFLTMVFCVNIYCQELEFVGIHYYCGRTLKLSFNKGSTIDTTWYYS